MICCCPVCITFDDDIKPKMWIPSNASRLPFFLFALSITHKGLRMRFNASCIHDN